MPGLGAGYEGPDDDGENNYTVVLMVAPEEHLPIKEWTVEVGQTITMKEVKEIIQVEYMMDAVHQRLATTNSAVDPGMKDTSRITDLPNDAEHSDVKKIYLLPKRGHEKEFLDKVLDWANDEDCIEDYTSKGAVYTGREADMSKMGGDNGGHRQSRVSVMAGEMFQKAKSAKRKPPANECEMKVDENGGLVMEEGHPPAVERMPFNLAFSIISLFNMIIVALEADFTCWGIEPCAPADRMDWYAMDCIFAMVFVIEVGCRVSSLGFLSYFLGDPLVNKTGFHIPHIVDFLIVFFRFLDTFVFDQLGIDTRIKIISCLRIIQFARVAKLARLVKGVRELWLIVAGLMDLMKTVLWVMLLLLIIFWVVGIMMTIIIGHDDHFFDYSKSHWGKSAYFDTVPKSLLSLFQIMTLSQWSSVLIRPIQEQYPAMFLLFIPFLCITTIGLLNIIVGVVVESTLNSAQLNAEKEGKELQKMHARVMESLKMVFEEADTDGGGGLDKDELHKALKKPHVRDRMKVLDIPIKDLDQLFDVLDEEKIGEIRTDQFFRGCSRLRGEALACDLHRMSIDFNRYNSWTDNLVQGTRETNERLSSLLHDMESVDRDIIKGESDEHDPVLGCRRDRSFQKDRSWQAEHVGEDPHTKHLHAQEGNHDHTHDPRGDTKHTQGSLDSHGHSDASYHMHREHSKSSRVSLMAKMTGTDHPEDHPEFFHDPAGTHTEAKIRKQSK